MAAINRWGRSYGSIHQHESALYDWHKKRWILCKRWLGSNAGKGVPPPAPLSSIPPPGELEEGEEGGGQREAVA